VKNQNTQKGFTVIELIVVLVVITTLFSIVVLNFNASKSSRNLNIAANELVENLRNLQTASLTGRNLATAGGAPAFYVLRLKSNYRDSYVFSKYDKTNVQLDYGTTTLANGIQFKAIGQNAVTVTDKMATGTCTTTCNRDCIDIAFELPFGSIYADESCNIFNTVTHPNQLQSRATYSNRIVELNLIDVKDSTKTIKVVVNGVTGRISKE